MFVFIIPEDQKSDGFDDIVDRYEKRVYNLIYRLVGTPEDAADLTQETFIAAFRAYRDFRGDSGVYTWLCSIAINKCKNRFRDRDRQSSIEGLPLDDAILERTSTASKWDNPEQSLEHQELKSLVEQAIGRLPYDYRIVVLLRDLQGLTYQEIADATELSLEVVKTRLARARAMLKRALEPYIIAE